MTEVLRPDGADQTTLMNGTTVHGIQSTDPAKAQLPTAYYNRARPVRRRLPDGGRGRRSTSIGIIGLGAGALTPYLQPGSTMTYFEIDPVVAEVASDPRFFTFLAGADRGTAVDRPRRRAASLQTVADGSFDLLVVDAFSSDAVPTHLLTTEAYAFYQRVLKPGGLVVTHIPNRYYDLAPGRRRRARRERPQRRDQGLPGRRRRRRRSDDPHGRGARRAGLDPLLAAGWKPLAPTVAPMTDDFMDVLRFLRPLWSCSARAAPDGDRRRSRGRLCGTRVPRRRDRERMCCSSVPGPVFGRSTRCHGGRSTWPTPTAHARRRSTGRERFATARCVAQLFAPFALLPWPVFVAVSSRSRSRWSCSSRARSPLVVLVPPVLLNLFAGNVDTLMGMAVVVGFRWPGAWAGPAADEGHTRRRRPVAFRREWRRFAIAVGFTALVAAVSFAIAPHLWFEWFAALRSMSALPQSDLVPPLAIRVPIAIGITAYAAVTDRKWLVPVACLVAVPNPWLVTGAVLGGSVALFGRDRTSKVVAPPADVPHAVAPAIDFPGPGAILGRDHPRSDAEPACPGSTRRPRPHREPDDAAGSGAALRVGGVAVRRHPARDLGPPRRRQPVGHARSRLGLPAGVVGRLRRERPRPDARRRRPRPTRRRGRRPVAIVPAHASPRGRAGRRRDRDEDPPRRRRRR